MRQIRRVLVVATVILFALSFACSSKNNKSKNNKNRTPSAKVCKTDRDCGGPPNLCAQGKCSRPSTGNVYKNPSLVSPRALKKELQKHANERQKRLDRGLEADK